MKRALAGAVLVTALALASCAAQPGDSEEEEIPLTPGGSSESSTIGGDFEEHSFTTRDGTHITCITWSSWDLWTESQKSGLSCFPKTAR